MINALQVQCKTGLLIAFRIRFFLFIMGAVKHDHSIIQAGFMIFFFAKY